MPKCKSCGKKGLFLKLNKDGLCQNCESKQEKHNEQVNEVLNACKEDYYLLPDCIISDVETTGLDSFTDHITEISGIKIQHGSITDVFSELVQLPPKSHIPAEVVRKTGITEKMLEKEGIPLNEAMKEYANFIGDLPLVGHNMDKFDYSFIGRAFKSLNMALTNLSYDTLKIAQSIILDDNLNGYSLSNLRSYTKIKGGTAHRSLGDCETTLNLFKYLRDYTATDMLKWHIKGKPITPENEFPHYITFHCPKGGASQFQKLLIDDGLLEVASLNDSLNAYTTDQLRDILSSNNLQVSGVKQALISRIVDNIPESSINIDTIYIPSASGNKHIEKYPHQAYSLHK